LVFDWLIFSFLSPGLVALCADFKTIDNADENVSKGEYGETLENGSLLSGESPHV